MNSTDQNKKIVLITTGQPSCNPRIVKEADTLSNAGFDVTVLYSFFIQWAQENDKFLLKNVLWKYKMVGGSRGDNKLLYFFTRLRFKINRIVNRYVGNKFLLAERTQARTYDELLFAAKKIKADWYIGHNLGALSIAVNAAKYNNAKAGFDFEDYHRGENNEAKKEEIDRIIYLENKYVIQLDYISAASPMIAEKIGDHFPFQKKKITTLLNCFPLSQQPPFREKAADDASLQLFWFSQTIGLNRGLEILIEALVEMNDPDIHLTLAGYCNNEFKQYLDKTAKSISSRLHLAGIIPPGELPAFASRFDVGLALELTTPENRNICLTNKVFTYLMGGNAILLSNTNMQLVFNQSYQIGQSFKSNDLLDLMGAISCYQNLTNLRKQRLRNHYLASETFNWEKESIKLIDSINKF